MLLTSRAIALHTLRLPSERLLCTVLTEQAGVQTFAVHVSHSRTARVRHTLFAPLSLLNLEWQHRERASIQRPTAASLAGAFVSVPFEPKKQAIALYLADALRHAVHAAAEDRRLFAYVWRSLEWLDACPEGYENFHIVFLLRLSELLGFAPAIDSYRPGWLFDLRQACFVGARPEHGEWLNAAEAALLPTLWRLRYGTMSLLRLSGAERARLLDFINVYFRLHLPDFPTLRSAQVLSEVFR